MDLSGESSYTQHTGSDYFLVLTPPPSLCGFLPQLMGWLLALQPPSSHSRSSVEEEGVREDAAWWMIQLPTAFSKASPSNFPTQLIRFTDVK